MRSDCGGKTPPTLEDAQIQVGEVGTLRECDLDIAEVTSRISTVWNHHRPSTLIEDQPEYDVGAAPVIDTAHT